MVPERKKERNSLRLPCEFMENESLHRHGEVPPTHLLTLPSTASQHRRGPVPSWLWCVSVTQCKEVASLLLAEWLHLHLSLTPESGRISPQPQAGSGARVPGGPRLWAWRVASPSLGSPGALCVCFAGRQAGFGLHGLFPGLQLPGGVGLRLHQTSSVQV